MKGKKDTINGMSKDTIIKVKKKDNKLGNSSNIYLTQRDEHAFYYIMSGNVLFLKNYVYMTS